MTTGNGKPDAAEYGRRLADVDATLLNLRAERDRIDAAIASWAERRLEVSDAAAAAGVAALAEQGMRRSLLTAKQKSEIIRSRGKVFYDALPWA